MMGASIKDVRGVTELNKQLMGQRGAVSGPHNLLHNAGKDVTTLESGISELVEPSDEAQVEPSSSVIDPPEEQ
jgi:hypothetical protein